MDAIADAKAQYEAYKARYGVSEMIDAYVRALHQVIDVQAERIKAQAARLDNEAMHDALDIDRMVS